MIHSFNYSFILTDYQGAILFSNLHMLRYMHILLALFQIEITIRPDSC